jgi:hypothetical protein
MNVKEYAEKYNITWNEKLEKCLIKAVDIVIPADSVIHSASSFLVKIQALSLVDVEEEYIKKLFDRALKIEKNYALI